jgi:phosphomethylpyrimidine synthase
VREFAAKQGISEIDALKQGMNEKSVEFKQQGSEIYKEI